jgi:putative hydrolase of the HAD superfamily
MLQAVTFDFWRTLYQDTSAQDERLRLLEEALVRHAQPRPWPVLERAYHRALSALDYIWREEHSFITVERWLREMLTLLEADLPENTVIALRQPIEEICLHGDDPRPVPGVAEVIPRLSQRYRMGIISDVGLTPGRVLREVLRRDGLLPYFRVQTFSDEVGAAKPLPRPFLHTLNALKARPEEAAHVGDLPETDMAGARGVGMKAILFLGLSNRQDGRPLADAAFENYDELEALLERLSETNYRSER